MLYKIKLFLFSLKLYNTRKKFRNMVLQHEKSNEDFFFYLFNKKGEV